MTRMQIRLDKLKAERKALIVAVVIVAAGTLYAISFMPNNLPILYAVTFSCVVMLKGVQRSIDIVADLLADKPENSRESSVDQSVPA